MQNSFSVNFSPDPFSSGRFVVARSLIIFSLPDYGMNAFMYTETGLYLPTLVNALGLSALIIDNRHSMNEMNVLYLNMSNEKTCLSVSVAFCNYIEVERCNSRYFPSRNKF